MTFKWREIFAEKNELAKAAASRSVSEHANKHDELAISIRQLQDEHEHLEHACSLVIGEYTTAQRTLTEHLEEERRLDTQGKAAAQAGHAEAAAAIAHQLIGVRAVLTREQASIDNYKAAADKAKQAFAENGELLQAKMAEAKELDAEIDQAAVQHNINEAMKSVTSMTSHETPSFDQIRDQVRASQAQEDADSELQAADPNVSVVHEQHLLNTAAADDVMAAWGAKPAAPAQTGSPADRLMA